MTVLLPLRLLLPLTTTTTTTTSFSSSCSFSSPDFPCKSLKTPHSAGPNFSLYSPSSPSSLSFPHSHHRCIRKHRRSLFRPSWLCGHMRRDRDMDNWKCEEENVISMFGSDEEVGNQIPTQAQSIVEGSGTVLVSEFRPVPDVDYLQELLAIQQQGPRAIGFFGTRNMGFMHQELIEILSYAMVITKNHIYTSGASGTNAAVIRGALRAEKPELLTVILPQSLKKQPPESQELLSKVKNVIEKPHNDHLPLIEASSWCTNAVLSKLNSLVSDMSQWVQPSMRQADFTLTTALFTLLLSSSSPNASYFSFLKADFFTWSPTELFDLLLDYTLFCAFEPDMRLAWAKRIRDILKPGGELITLMFPLVT